MDRERLGVKAVVIRPDRYIFGVANTPAELDDVVRLSASSLDGTVGQAQP